MKKNIIAILLALSLIFSLVACNSKTNYSVQFDTLCDIVIQSEDVQHGEKIARPTDPYRENYQFDGWYASKDYNEEDKWSFIGYTVTNNMTLYAKWIALPTPGLNYKLINENEYEVSSGEAIFFGYKDIVIPPEYNGLPVTHIAKGAFQEGMFSGERITSIILPYTITDIGERAFADCAALTSFVIPNRVKTIGEFAFSNCTGLTNIIIPENVTYIANHAFVNCTGLTSIIIPEHVDVLERNVFASCHSLTIYVEFIRTPLEGWDTDWNLHNRPVVFGCFLFSDRTYVVNFFKRDEIIVNPKNYIINAPYRDGYIFNGWTNENSNNSNSNIELYVIDNIESAPNNVRLYAIWTKAE